MVVLRGRAPSTVRKYSGAFLRWKKWAKGKHVEIQILPAKPLHVALYLAFLIQKSSTSAPVEIITSCREKFDYIVRRIDGYGSLMETTVLHSHLPMFMCFVYPLPCNISSSRDLFMLFISFLTDLHTFGHPHFFIMFLAFFFICKN